MDFTEDYIHGLSQVDFYGLNKDFCFWAYWHMTKKDVERVAILDGLALLLVFASQGDVAAVSYWHSGDEFNILWAKNQPVDNSSQLQYIEELLQKAKDGIETKELLNMVIPMCKEKIFHRVQKLAKSFGVSLANQRKEDFNLWGFNKTKEPFRKLEAALKRAGWLEDLSTIERLDDFTRSIGLITKTSATREFSIILRFAWTVSVDGLEEVLKGSQARYLNKLSDYVRSLVQIRSLLKNIRTVKIVATQVREFTVCS